jgi:hypothetical protein
MWKFVRMQKFVRTGQLTGASALRKSAGEVIPANERGCKKMPLQALVLAAQRVENVSNRVSHNWLGCKRTLAAPRQHAD